jgi:hypothetical protein
MDFMLVIGDFFPLLRDIGPFLGRYWEEVGG